jgi:hypothetical protein
MVKVKDWRSLDWMERARLVSAMVERSERLRDRSAAQVA